MKCNLPKSWHSLPPKEKELINEAFNERLYAELDREEAELQEIWIKLACVLLHDLHGFTEEELMKFIAGWKRIYRRNERAQNNQTEWLAEEMEKCFPNCGFPQIRIDELKNWKGATE